MKGPRVLIWPLLFALSLSVPVVSGETAEQTSPPKAAPAAASASAVIPVADVPTEAAQVPALLRSLTEALAPSAQIENIHKNLPGLRKQMDLELDAAATILRGQPTLDAIQAQQHLWQQRQLQTTEWLSVLTHRATRLQAALSRLADVKNTWRRTLDASRAAKAPGPIIAQIDGALAALNAAETPLAAERTALLDLQSVVAQEVARSSTALAQFTQAQQRAVGGILTRDSPPLWAAETWVEARATLGARVREIAVARWHDVVLYVRDPWSGMLLHAAIFAALAATFCAARRQVRSARGAGEESPFTGFDRPYAAALAVTLIIASGPYSGAPPSLQTLCEAIMLVPVIRLIRPTLDPRLVPAVYTLAGIFAVDSLREFLGGVTLLEHAILEVEMLAGMAMLVHALLAGALRLPASGETPAERLPVYRAGAVLVVLALAAGLVASAAGYMRLARLVASGLFGSGALALTLYAGVQVAAAMTAFVLRLWPLRLLWAVQHHRDLLEGRAFRLLAWLAVGGWAFRFLDYLGLLQPVMSLGKEILALQLGRGSISFSLGSALEFVLTVWLAYLLSVFIRFVLREDVYPRTRMTRGISYAVSSVLNYAILAIGFLLGLGVLGLDLTKVTILAGALGVGIGFGLQGVVNNFVSGLILLFERPIHVGDSVEIGDLLGEVSRIGIRSSTVRTWRGSEIIVPNAQLVSERVTNWTLSDRRRRIDLAVGVDYGTAPEKVVEVLEAVAREHPHVLKDPAPQAVFLAFGDSAISFELRAWTNRFEHWPTIRTELAAAVYAALRAAGMTFPFPQREVRLLHDAVEGPAQVLSAASSTPAKPQGRAAAAVG